MDLALLTSRLCVSLPPACCLLLFAACGNSVPDSSQFGAADTANSGDGGGLGDSAVTADSSGGPSDSSPTDAGPIDAGTSDAGAPDAGASPTCFEALNCLLEKKQWTPGKAPPKDGSCMAGMVDDEAMQSDALVGCVQTTCKTEFDAWDKGGAGQLNSLYGCMIEKCAEPLATCVGGEGDKNCADAVKCLQACPPLDKECTVPCMRPTSAYQSKKTGKLLACVFQKCTLATLTTCPIDQSCAIAHCLELAG